MIGIWLLLRYTINNNGNDIRPNCTEGINTMFIYFSVSESAIYLQICHTEFHEKSATT